MGFRHNKKRNVALLYEFLIRHISKCLINNNKQGAQQALEISRRYFSKGTVLNQELSLFNSVLNTSVKSRESAHRILGEIYNISSSMNSRKLDSEKSKLIKEINYTLKDKFFYGCKIPNYTVYASVQTLLNETRYKKKNVDPVDKIKLEDSVIEYLISEQKSEAVEALKVNPNYNNAVYKFAIERFHKKYSENLNEAQKKILTKYSVSLISGNTGVLKSALQKESKIINEKLLKVKDDDIRKDKDLTKKLQECQRKFNSIDFEEITENKVLDVLQFMHLVEEIES